MSNLESTSRCPAGENWEMKKHKYLLAVVFLWSYFGMNIPPKAKTGLMGLFKKHSLSPATDPQSYCKISEFN